MAQNSDGSVVLQAQDTQFRVHFGVIAQQSSVFREMQGLPQPPDEPTVEGCPIVELQDDASDVKNLLVAVYDPTFLAQTAIPLPQIASLIRLGRKYDFRKLLDSAVERITFENPTTLAEFDARRAKDGNSPARIMPYKGILLDMLTLARENRLMTALPCAYYRVLAKHTRVQLFDGVARGDGTVATLAYTDQRQCILSHDGLCAAQFQESYTLGWLCNRAVDDCEWPDQCTEARNRIKNSVLGTPRVGMLTPPNPHALRALCTSCVKHTNELIRQGREKAWADLPSFFGLPPWNELKNDL
ncbi:hypothetical protein C8R46DRAFT_1157655 [Mycena filopes]|nr:hypothetical protein C8R46DRAFT_1157655 [Mycena filopes]